MTFINKKTTIILFICTLLSGIGYTQKNLEKKLDSLLEAKFKPNRPGAVAMIAKDGKIIYQKAYGSANLELDIPMSTYHVFKIGSITKQFTAVSILMLLEQGKLTLEDDITMYLPDYPTHGQKITIHNLLTHTSGIKNYTAMQTLGSITKKDLTPKQLINFFKNEPVNFNPGEQYKYNNSGYVILGYIIESITKQSYQSFVEQHIFNPLHMSSSYYGSSKRIIKNRASGYHGKKSDYINAFYLSLTLPYSAGSLMSSTEDLLKWQNALKNNVLLKEATKEKAFTNYKLKNNTPINYGYGWGIKHINNLKTFEHGGSIPGFKSMAIYVPNIDTYIVILTNCDCNSPTKITSNIAEEVIDEFTSQSRN